MLISLKEKFNGKEIRLFFNLRYFKAFALLISGVTSKLHPISEVTSKLNQLFISMLTVHLWSQLLRATLTREERIWRCHRNRLWSCYIEMHDVKDCVQFSCSFRWLQCLHMPAETWPWTKNWNIPVKMFMNLQELLWSNFLLQTT